MLKKLNYKLLLVIFVIGIVFGVAIARGSCSCPTMW